LSDSTVENRKQTVGDDVEGPEIPSAVRGEPSGAIRWLVSMIACTRTTLKSEFKFRISHVLGVRASEASDLPMVGYPLELWRG
jgi:hypothetical protein